MNTFNMNGQSTPQYIMDGNQLYEVLTDPSQIDGTTQYMVMAPPMQPQQLYAYEEPQPQYACMPVPVMQPQQQMMVVETAPRRPTIRAPRQKKPSMHANSSCSHCGTTETTLWRRSAAGAVECNACNLYMRKNGRARPLSLAAKFGGIRKRKRNPRIEDQILIEEELIVKQEVIEEEPKPKKVKAPRYHYPKKE